MNTNIMKYVYITFIYALLYVIKLISTQTISIPYYHFSSHFTTELYLGTPSQHIHLYIDLSYKSSWLHSSSFNISSSRTVHKYSPYKLKLGYFFYNMHIISDVLIMNNEPLLNNFFFSYYDAIETPEGASISLSLSHNYDNISLSITERLYNEHKINAKQFAFISTNNTYGYVQFGTIHIPRNTYAYKTEINVINSEQWEINANAIYVNGYKYKNKSIMKSEFNIIFVSYDNDMQVPYDFLSFLEEHYIKDLISKRICTKNASHSYICKTNEIPSQLPSMYISITGKTINRIYLTKQILFSHNSPNCAFRIRGTSINDKWILGTSFIHNTYTIFNYDKQTITMFQNSRYAYIYLSIYWFIMINSSLLCCMGIYLVYMCILVFRIDAYKH